MKMILIKFWQLICPFVLVVSLLGAVAYASEVTAPSDPLIMDIPVDIIAEGELPQTPETFTLRLTAQQDSAPMPPESKDGVYLMSILGNEKGHIQIPCTKLGVYDYTLSLIPGEDPNCIYSTEVYHITLFILNGDDGGFDISAVAYKVGSDSKSEIRFVNRYADPAYVTVQALKLFDGQPPEDGRFTFALHNEAGELIAQVTNIGKSIVFPEIRCYQEGTFTYKISEIPGTEPTVIYDTTVYDVIIEVTRDEDLDYVATVRYEEGDIPIEDLPVFENVSYNPQIPDTGDKRNMKFYLILMIVGSVATVTVVSLLLFSRKKQNEDSP